MEAQCGGLADGVSAAGKPMAIFVVAFDSCEVRRYT
jgi:hypothetical protein